MAKKNVFNVNIEDIKMQIKINKYNNSLWWSFHSIYKYKIILFYTYN